MSQKTKQQKQREAVLGEVNRIHPKPYTAAELRLVCAAPDLLEACKLILSCAGNGSLSLATARTAAAKAIAKAEGI